MEKNMIIKEIQFLKVYILKGKQKMGQLKNIMIMVE